MAPIFAGKQPLLPQMAPVSILTTVPTLVVTRADSRFPDMKSVLAEAKAKPGAVSIGHSGNGTTNHVGILRLQLNEDVKFNIIPYRGAGPGIADLLAGNLDLFADQLTSSMPHIQSGKLRPLATFSLQRCAGPAQRADAGRHRPASRSTATRRPACSPIPIRPSPSSPA